MDEHEVKALIQSFLDVDLCKRTGVETVVLCGSHSTGRATAHSDIDLCYIGNFPDFKREVIAYNNHEFQLMIAPWNWYEDVISSYERKEGNIGTITTMIARGICVFGNSQKWEQLHSLGKEYFDLGPAEISARALVGIRLRLTGLFDNYIDQIVNSHEQTWLSFHLIQCCIESQFQIKKWWAVKPKYELEELRLRDSHMATLAEACLNTMGRDKEAVKKLCRHVLEPIGGFLRESITLESES